MTKYSALFGSGGLIAFDQLRPTLITDNTDFTVNVDAKADVGSPISFSIPSKGLLIIEPWQYAAKSNTGTSNKAAATWGVNISSNDYFPQSKTDTDANGYYSNYRLFHNSGPSYDNRIEWTGQYARGTITGIYVHYVALNIEKMSIPTGSQTVQMRIWNQQNRSPQGPLNVKGSSLRPLILGLYAISWS